MSLRVARSRRLEPWQVGVAAGAGPLVGLALAAVVGPTLAIIWLAAFGACCAVIGHYAWAVYRRGLNK